jgi:hypothetical protein
MNDPLRAHLSRVLSWEEAHVPFDRAVDGVPPDKRGATAPGFEHSLWQLLEHLRIAQLDLLDFCRNPAYAHAMTWPDDYWPTKPEPPDASSWEQSIAFFRRDQEAMKALVVDPSFDLFAPVPTGKPQQTGLRSILLTIDHNAYHVGQIVDLRKALGVWA